MDTVDSRAQRAGRNQRGRASRRQLRDDAAISAKALQSRLRDATWTEPLPNVIDLGTHRTTWRAQVIEVLLAAGIDRAWASYATAAHLHDFLDAGRPPSIDVTVPRGRHAKVGHHRLHTARQLGSDEVTVRHDLPCTTPARTLLDLAARTEPRIVERYLADALRRRIVTMPDLGELVDRHRHHPGRRRLIIVSERLPDGVEKLGSPLEVFGIQRLIERGVPPMILQYQLRDLAGVPVHRFDAAWPERATLLALDGAGYHDLLDNREHDAEVRSYARGRGWHVEVLRRADLDGPRLGEFVDELWRRPVGPPPR